MYDPIHPIIPDTPVESTTPNFKFVLYLKDTVTSWLEIFNRNMLAIDTAIHNCELRTSIDGQVPPELTDDVIKLNTEMAKVVETSAELKRGLDALDISLTNMDERVANNTSEIGLLKTNTLALDTRVTALESRMIALEQTVQKLVNNGNGGGADDT